MKKAELEQELRKAKKARDAYHAKFLTLLGAVKALYVAAYWHADRPVDEKALWTAVRDAALISPGQSKKRLGPDRSGCVACELSAISDPRGSGMKHTCGL